MSQPARERLTAERIEQIRNHVRTRPSSWTAAPMRMVRELLAELDAVRAERDKYGETVNKLTFRIDAIIKQRDAITEQRDAFERRIDGQNREISKLTAQRVVLENEIADANRREEGEA